MCGFPSGSWVPCASHAALRLPDAVLSDRHPSVLRTDRRAVELDTPHPPSLNRVTVEGTLLIGHLSFASPTMLVAREIHIRGGKLLVCSYACAGLECSCVGPTLQRVEIITPFMLENNGYAATQPAPV